MTRVAVAVLLLTVLSSLGWGFSCPPPPPPANGQTCAHWIPFVGVDEGRVLFLGAVTEVFPQSWDHYEQLWEGAFGEMPPDDREPTPESERAWLAKTRLLTLALWRDILSPAEEERVRRAATMDELKISFEDWGPFQQRVRFGVLESTAPSAASARR